MGFLIGSAVGGVIGYIAEDVATDGSGIEYVLTLDDGRVVTIVQNSAANEEPLPEGAEVYVQFSSNYVRVLKRPEIAPKPGIWINPDVAPPGPADGRPKAKAPLDGPGSATAAAAVDATAVPAEAEPAEAAPAGAWVNPDSGAEESAASAAESVPPPRERPETPEPRPAGQVPKGF